MRAKSRYTRLSDVPNLQFVEEYKTIVNPWDYDCCVNLKADYCVLGVKVEGCIPRLYVTPIVPFKEYSSPYFWTTFLLESLPAVLFDFDWGNIPKDWMMRVTGEHRDEIEILPKALALDELWFEKYLDAEEDAVNLVNHEIMKAFMRLESE